MPPDRSISATAERLLVRAAAAHAIRSDLTITDLLALTGAAAIASADATHAQRPAIVRDGFVSTP